MQVINYNNKKELCHVTVYKCLIISLQVITQNYIYVHVNCFTLSRTETQVQFVHKDDCEAVKMELFKRENLTATLWASGFLEGYHGAE